MEKQPVLTKLNELSILICGQRFTSRTETLEKYFVNHSRKVGVIANAGVRQKQNSNCKLYRDGKIAKEFDLPGFSLQSESLMFTLLVGFYFISFLKNFLVSYRRLDTKFDLYIGVQTWSALLGVLLKKFGKVDKVIYYSIDYYKPTSRFGSKIESFVFRHLDRYCCRNSDMIWNLAPHFSEDRKEYFPRDDYGDKEIRVTLTYSESLLMNRELDEIEKHSIAFVGTLEGGQGWEVLIKSVPIVKRRFSDFKLHVYGDGSYKPAILDLIREAGAEESVVMHGFIKEESELLGRLSKHAAGVAPFQPHRAEYAGLDAGKPKLYALTGLPIIMTHTEFLESQFKKFGCGTTFKYDPESLAEAIIGVIQDDSKLAEYKKRANDFAKSFTSEVVFPQALDRTMEVIRRRKEI